MDKKKKKHKKIVFLIIIFFLISFGVKIITMALHMQSSWMHRNHFQFHFSNAKSFICGKCSFNDFYLMAQTLYTILKEMLYNWLLSFFFFFYVFSHHLNTISSSRLLFKKCKIIGFKNSKILSTRPWSHI